MKFVDELPKTERVVRVRLRVHGYESVVEASDGATIVDLLGIRSDGTVVRYEGQKAKLEALGFATDNKGVIKLFN